MENPSRSAIAASFARRNPNLQGAAYMVVGSCGYVANDALIRLATEEGLAVYQALFFRSIAATTLFGAAVWRGTAGHPSRRATSPLTVRVGAEVVATASFFAAIVHLDFADAQTILLIVPFAVTLVAGSIGGESVTRAQYVVVAGGFAGVLLVVQPGTGAFSPWSIAVLASAAAMTLREFATRRVDASIPASYVAFITAVAIGVLTGLLAPLTGWTPITGRAAILVLLASLCLVVGYVCTIETVRVGDLSVSAPFRYSALVLAVVLGIALFDELPNSLTTAGCVVIVCSGIFALHLERKASAKR